MMNSMRDKNASWSEIETWCACRQKWAWAYEVGIVPIRVKRAPAVGSCGHAAVAAALHGKSWAAAVKDWLKKELDKELFDEDADEVHAVADTVGGIMPRYLNAYPSDFEPVLVEHKFEIPIRGLRINLVGYWDALVRGRDKRLWLMEHKFPQQRLRSEEDLLLNGQIGVYQYAAHRLGYSVVGTIYNQLLGRLPAEPKLNNDGSMSKSKVYTDWLTYRSFLTKHKLDPNDYLDMETKLADFKFFQRNYIYRPLVEVRLFTRDIERRIWDMRSVRKHIYRNESFIVCGRCPYRELCIESLKGGDIEYIIKNEFEPRELRKKEEFYDYEQEPQVKADA